MVVDESQNTDSALAKQGFANDTGGLNVAFDTPGDATAFAPTQATSGFRDALLKALSSNSLHKSQKKEITWMVSLRFNLVSGNFLPRIAN